MIRTTLGLGRRVTGSTAPRPNWLLPWIDRTTNRFHEGSGIFLVKGRSMISRTAVPGTNVSPQSTFSNQSRARAPRRPAHDADAFAGRPRDDHD